MKSVYRNLGYLCIIISCFIALSCSNVMGPTNVVPSKPGNNYVPPKDIPQYQKDAINKFGRASRIFSADRYSPRFMTGQNVKSFFYDMDNNIYFEGNLVEYDSIDPQIMQYVESIPKSNAWMHQGYGNIDYIKGKTYVEFASYYDADFEQIVQYEIRIFDGDFWNNRNDEGWYAKAVTFSPDFKIDVNNQINIETGEYAYYEYPNKIKFNTTLDYSKYDLTTVPSPSPYINKIANNAKVYQYKLKNGVTDDYKPIERNYSNVEYNTYDCYLVEADSLVSLIDGYNKTFGGRNDSFRYNYNNFSFDPNKNYLEFIVYTGDESLKVNFIELRIRNNDGKVTNHKFSKNKFDKLIKAVEDGKTINEYAPFSAGGYKDIYKLGNCEETYNVSYEINDNWSNKSYVEAKLFVFSSYIEKVNRQLDVLKNRKKDWIRFNYNIPNGYDNSKNYLEVLCYVDKKSGKINAYEFNFRDNNNQENKAYSMVITPEQYASFTNPEDNSIPEKNTVITDLNDYEGPVKYKEAMNLIGNVNKVYAARTWIPRYATGQNIRHFNGWANKIQFEGNLIEYNYLNSDFKSYFERYEAKDGCMNQNYEDASYDSSKIYVEIGCFKDLDHNNAVVEYDIRVFEGDPFNYSAPRMMRIFTFSPDMKIDITHNIDVTTNKEAYYKYPDIIEMDRTYIADNYHCVSTSVPDTYLSSLVNVNKIYKLDAKEPSLYNKDAFLETWYGEDEDLKIDAYFVEINSLNPTFKEYVSKINNTSYIKYNYDDVTKSYDKTYAEYLVYTGVTSNTTQFYELRMLDKNNNVKIIAFKDFAYRNFANGIKNNKPLKDIAPIQTTLTDKMKNLGSFVTYYDNYDAVSFIDGENYYVNSRLFEYNTLNNKANALYREVENDNEWGMWSNYGNEYDNSHRYIEVLTFLHKETNEVLYYELRYRIPTGNGAHGFNISKEQLDILSDPSNNALPKINSGIPSLWDL